MEKDEQVVEELRNLNQKVAKLEKVIGEFAAKEKEASTGQILFDTIKYLLIGLLIIGPIVSIGWGVVLVISSWLGADF